MKTASIISFLAVLAAVPMAVASPQADATCHRQGDRCDGSPERACNCPNTDIVSERFSFVIAEYHGFPSLEKDKSSKSSLTPS